MTGKERLQLYLQGGQVDRIPVFPNIHFGTAKFCGYSIRDFATNAEINSNCLVQAFRAGGYDGIQVGSDVTIEGEAVGSQVHFSDDNPPSVKIPFLKTPDLSRLIMPDPLRDGRMPMLIESTRSCHQEVGDKAYIIATLMGPFSAASQIRGVQDLLMETVTDPGFVDDLMQFSVELGIAYGRELLKAGARGLLLGEALCSPQMISPKFYKDNIVKHQKKLFAGLYQAGAEVIFLHICGNIKPILPICLNLEPAVGLDLDQKTDPREVFALSASCSRSVFFRGNLEPATTLNSNDRDQIINACREIIDLNREQNRLILSSGCNMNHWGFPENAQAMVFAAEEFGQMQPRN